MKRAVISGTGGQDGSYLAEFLLEKGYDVHGIVRRPVTSLFENLVSCRDRITLHQADMTDVVALHDIIAEVQPDEVYNLAAQTFVPASWTQPFLTCEVTGIGAIKFLAATKRACPRARFYQASSSEMFGNASAPQNEETKMVPASPYGCAKLLAHAAVRAYRDKYGLFACSGICFNHESSRRGREFVTRKVCEAAARIKLGLDKTLTLGNLQARRDWGYAPDYVGAMWAMLQQPNPDDYVIATGTSFSVETLVKEAFGCVGLPWFQHVGVEADLLRKNDIHELRGDASKARTILGWEPQTSFRQMIRLMVDAEIERIKG